MPAKAPVVLLAEDDPEMRALLTDAMERWGLAVSAVATGHELAHRLFGGGELPDLVVTDVRMPGPSGLSTLRCMRIESWATPVILVTAFPDRALLNEAKDLGALVLEKPFPINHLERCVRAALRP